MLTDDCPGLLGRKSRSGTALRNLSSFTLKVSRLPSKFLNIIGNLLKSLGPRTAKEASTIVFIPSLALVFRDGILQDLPLLSLKLETIWKRLAAKFGARF